jgi:AraC-like DNA-binding protein
VDTHVPLDDVWGRDGSNLREQLLEAGSTNERLVILEGALLGRLSRARPGHPAARAAVKALLAARSDLRVTDVALDVGLSHRRFIQVFEREVGLTPKLFTRLRRFHRVKHEIATLGKPPSWATFALACGYFDQSHLIRDFLEFSGVSPTSYLHGRTDETMFDHYIHAYRPE